MSALLFCPPHGHPESRSRRQECSENTWFSRIRSERARAAARPYRFCSPRAFSRGRPESCRSPARSASSPASQKCRLWWHRTLSPQTEGEKEFVSICTSVKTKTCLCILEVGGAVALLQYSVNIYPEWLPERRGSSWELGCEIFPAPLYPAQAKTLMITYNMTRLLKPASQSWLWGGLWTLFVIMITFSRHRAWPSVGVNLDAVTGRRNLLLRSVTKWFAMRLDMQQGMPYLRLKTAAHIHPDCSQTCLYFW